MIKILLFTVINKNIIRGGDSHGRDRDLLGGGGDSCGRGDGGDDDGSLREAEKDGAVHLNFSNMFD